MLLTLTVEVVVFVSLEQCSTISYYPPLLPARVPVASSLIIREKKEERKISKIYMPTSTSISKYLFTLLLAANVLLPRELDCCNYYVKEASKPTLRAAN
ncbi:hypothetical protein HBI38_213810 [Parastagonospora nodorum]|nr:hypothetical protein HBH74_236080 [Parastagonospora nodorum]KAH4939938.1 hypothetical protein HBH73_161020 [Parastagonospora nodorum]KAH6247008.1 hypothetical protein HBI41_230570 [Parastagonospora nodorum]KAH6266115.1 hypothetical protein HBI40_225270 [Parastagonospora nodorum]KAH6302601.1 hypothetical protein HBI38_213810 [Parastagonospora nodorum]